MEKLRVGLPEGIEVISPAKNKSDNKEVGLYPDRIYCKCINENEYNLSEIIGKIKSEYGDELNVNTEYFNVYAVVVEADSNYEAIKKLNEKLDFLELYKTAISEEAEKSIRKLVFKKSNSELFNIALNKPVFPVDTLAQIASAALVDVSEFEYVLSKWEDDFKKEDELIKTLKERFGKDFKTPYKYICIVHADGDNMGNIITHASNNNAEISEKLIAFGAEACEIIKSYKGMPIYAGGDDLLFIAPVLTGANTTIFDLLKEVDNLYVKKGLTAYKGEKDGKETSTSMSYGISITYYKYPLYEALNMSRSLLFDVAKNVENKNAIAWTLQKNSGSTVIGSFSKSNTELYEAFEKLMQSINDKVDNNLVSAVAHKIKSSEKLLGFFMKETVNDLRLEAFFEKTLEYNSKNKEEQKYLDAVKTLLTKVCQSAEDMESAINIMYGMLRTAKFIKGLEEDKDE